ncbi:MAG: hypothetical protein ACK4U0_15720 [Mesorhizobium sp.]
MPDLNGLVGWTPARYLHFARSGDDRAEELPAPLPNPQVVDPSQVTVGILPEPLPMPDDPLAESAQGPVVEASDLQTALLAPVAHASSNGTAIFDAAREAQKIDGAATDLTLAYATRSDVAVSDVYSAFGSEAERDAAGASGVVDASVPSGVPLPSPRPSRETEQEPSPAPDLMVAAAPSTEAASPVGPSSPPASMELEASALTDQEASTPGEDVASDPSMVQEAVVAAAEPLSPPTLPSPPPVLVGPLAAVDAPEDRSLPSAVGSEPSGVETSRSAVPTPTIEPAAGQEDGEEAEQSLREQIAALLPSWSRPATLAPESAAPSAFEDAGPIETVAETRPTDPETPAEAILADIPCARYVGQPMTRCDVSVLRLAGDEADVTVLWPDGGERLIRFRGGKPDSSNGRGEFRFTREAELNLIRIGVGERFEILDALPFAE